LIALKLMDGRDAVLSSQSYIRELGTLKKWADARWITWGRDLDLLPPTRWLTERVPETSIVLRSSSINALLSAAESGLGLVLLSKEFSSVRPIVEASLSPALAREAETLPVLELWLVGHRALRAVPRVAAVWDLIIEEFARFQPKPLPPRRRK
jgi:DNA-binding transcriptional LysR family regulator